MGLSDYNKKRNFLKTAEPKGKKRTTKEKIFVVQYHRARKDHYDFRLEWKGVLLSWAVPKGLSQNPKEKRLAIRVEDHPVDYARFEGVIPKGEYGAGTVIIWDNGIFEPLTNFDEGLKKGVLKFNLIGKRLKGAWALIRLKDDKNWIIVKENDDFACDTENKLQTSVLTGRTSQQLLLQEDLSLKQNPFDWADVQLATPAEKVPTEEGWMFELKYDGYRALAYAENSKLKLFSRNKKELTKKFKNLALEIEKWSNSRAFVLDGEIVALDQNGKSDFQALQNHLKGVFSDSIVYVVFDLLALDGKDLRDMTLIDRKEILKKLLNNAPQNIVFSEHILSQGENCFNAAKNMGLEGIVAKRIESKYTGKRNEDWLKIKCRKSLELVVGGFVKSEKKKNGIKSLLLGMFFEKKLIYFGRVGTGIRICDEKELFKEFKKLILKNSPFDKTKKLNSQNEEVIWLKPKIVVEVEYAEITNENLLRQASFKCVRLDKVAEEIRCDYVDETKIEKIQNTMIENVEISNPNKILYKDCGVTKLDVINYYQSVSKRMIKLIKHRLLSVVRCHGIVSKETSFFKKHPSTKAVGIKIVDIKGSEGEKSEYFCVENESGLISQVQLGTIEFHPWGSTIEKLENPDLMVFDLDPDEGLDIKNVRQGVRDLKKILDSLSLKSFLKTSGGKGYHVVVPFVPNSSWESFRNFAENVAVLMEQKWPDRYTTNMRKDARKGKIFIDWVRNGRGATSVAAYSLRARVGAKVSMPIFWSELDKILPNEIDIFNASERLKKRDPWAEIFSTKQKLN